MPDLDDLSNLTRLAQWLVSHGETLQFALLFAGFLSLAVIERFVPRRPVDADHRRRWVTNILLTCLSIAVLMALPASFVTAAFWAEGAHFGLLNRADLPMPALALATVLLRAFISFGTHYLMHKVPLLWRFHRVHHLDTELDVSTTARFHPLEMPLGLAIGLPVVVGLGLTPWALILYEALDVGVTLFSHANIRLPAAIDRWLRYLIVTPDLHRVHHSAYQPETDSNFGAVFPIWDVVFGTLRTETRESQVTMQLGLSEVREPRSNELRWLLWSPLRASRGDQLVPTAMEDRHVK
ncbi:MAG: sterol desaturase family protein [Planctomycetes bacterium]|nr:sterol desaturase family protein [Planctomycetota bacterium]